MASCTLDVHLKPRSKHNRIVVSQLEIIEISVTSPPVDNKANDQLIRLLAESLDLPKSAFGIIKGGHSRLKVVSVEGLTKDSALERLKSRAGER